MILPNSLVKKLIEKYEHYEISLSCDKEYISQKNKILSKRIITHQDFYHFIETTKKNKFTYFLYDNSIIFTTIKKLFIPKTENVIINDVKFKDMRYIKFNIFSMDIIDSVSNIIKQANEKHLILDLRSNIGGNLQSCLNLVNILVPKGKVLEIQNKEGQNHFYSSGNHKSFKRIYVLISESTASCSEILSMVLQKKLNNVVLIGHKENFKLYTQHVITNKLFRYSFSIADGIWTVDGEDASNLRSYLFTKDGNFNNLNEYLKFILMIHNNYSC